MISAAFIDLHLAAILPLALFAIMRVASGNSSRAVSNRFRNPHEKDRATR
jgi:hypothetical protein